MNQLVLQTHEAYLHELVQATVGAQLTVRRLARNRRCDDDLSLAADGTFTWAVAARAGWAAHRLVGAALLLRVTRVRQLIWRESFSGAISTQADPCSRADRGGQLSRELREAWELTRSWPKDLPVAERTLRGAEYWMA